MKKTFNNKYKQQYYTNKYKIPCVPYLVNLTNNKQQ